MALSIAHREFNYTHYDLHYRNVLIRKTDMSYIPYQTDAGLLYVKTDGVATIIDYGYSHIRFPEGDIGVSDPNLTAHAIFPNASFQLHDAFKLLMFSASSAYTNRNSSLLEGLNRIFAFFNNVDNITTAINALRSTAYSLPYTPLTSRTSLIDLLSYIRDNIYETSSIVFMQVPTTGNILGCIGTDLCMSTEQTIQKLGLDKSIHIATVFDFCDIVSELEFEGKTLEIENIIRYFDVSTAYTNAIDDLNQIVGKLNDKSKTLYIFSFGNITDILYPKIYNDFKAYISNIFEVYDLHQQAQVIMNCLVEVSKYYELDTDQIQNVENYIITYYEDFLKVIESIKIIDAGLSRIMPPDQKDKYIPELSILSKL